MQQRFGTGMTPSPIMLLGEAYQDEAEFMSGEALTGTAGIELSRMLHEAKIMRSGCYATNVVNLRPPGNNPMAWVALKKSERTSSYSPLHGMWVRQEVHEGVARLRKELELVQPNVVIACGNLALFAMTGAWSVAKWRGSMLTSQGFSREFKVIPTYHPRTILGQWENRAAMVRDLQRAYAEQSSPTYLNRRSWEFTIRPSLPVVFETLNRYLASADAAPSEGIWVDFDLETRAGHIACAGISVSLTEAICIPFMCVEDTDGYWRPEEEAAVIHLLYRLLTHPKVNVRGQNLLYDAQYTYRHWHFVPRVRQDTMLSHHTLFPALPKRLDFQASLYCSDYVYWKDDGKTWTKDVGEDQLWQYNAVDCVRTRESGEVELEAIKAGNLTPQHDFMQEMFWPVLKAMQLGVKIDLVRRAQIDAEMSAALLAHERFFEDVLGHKLNPRSSKQMIALFYTDLGVPPVYSRAKKGKPATVTCDEEALHKIKVKAPILGPLIDMILQYRQLSVSLSTFIRMPLDSDNRMRCSYNLCGTNTYRLSSSENAFGTGGNLQNVPKGDE